MIFLLRYWRIGAALLVVLGLAAAVIGFGHSRYDAGRTAERARWQAKFDQAQRDLAAANARTEALESAQIAISDDYARRFSESNQILAERSAAADARIRKLMRELAARPNRCDVHSDGIPTVPIDDPSEVGERFERIGGDLTALAGRCESDATTLSLLQQWIRAQSELVAAPGQ